MSKDTCHLGAQLPSIIHPYMMLQGAHVSLPKSLAARRSKSQFKNSPTKFLKTLTDGSRQIAIPVSPYLSLLLELITRFLLGHTKGSPSLLNKA